MKITPFPLELESNILPEEFCNNRNQYMASYFDDKKPLFWELFGKLQPPSPPASNRLDLLHYGLALMYI